HPYTTVIETTRAIHRRCQSASTNDCYNVRQVAATKYSIVRKYIVYRPIAMIFFTELTAMTNSITRRCRISKFQTGSWQNLAVFGFPCIKKCSSCRNLVSYSRSDEE